MQEEAENVLEPCRLSDELRWRSIEEFLRFRIEGLTKWKEQNGIDLSEQKMYVEGSIEWQYYNAGRRRGFIEALGMTERINSNGCKQDKGSF